MRILHWLLLGGLSAGLAGCDGPCRQLAERICQCRANAALQRSCALEIDAFGNIRQPIQAEEDRCVELLDTCDCDAIERENFEFCGLTKPPREGGQE